MQRWHRSILRISLIALETTTTRSVRRSHERAELEMPSNDRLRYSQSSWSSPEVRPGSTAVRATGFRMRGKKNPMRRPVECRSSISWRIQLHQGLPRRQNMVGSNEAQCHGQQEARPDQARGCWRWNIEEPAAGADDQAKNESDNSGSHSSALLRMQSNRNRNPIDDADAKCANAIR